ncbi:phospholipase A and acyltransferase 2-like [Oppia nitens]|uniref:phospholipase A and acyltransferase 2-like n=1 Tax=Oppia nitens TaxID=1686743 RepID=UPI0023DC2FA5|nr:phospholipase A and acyltransferase 2-like [Oppia nitens]
MNECNYYSVEVLLTMSSDNNNNNSNNHNINQLRLQLGSYRLASELTPELADIIEIDRMLYTHWAIYVGDGQVVDVVGDDDNDLPDNEEAIVRRSLLTDVAGDNYCRVNNKEVPVKERCLQPLPADLVVKEANAMVGSTVDYNLLTRNCEHYLTQWKYGQPWSDQAAVALSAIRALRREHKDSISDGHSFMVNTLNEVLNSPGQQSGSPSLNELRSNSIGTCQLTSASSQTEVTHVI